jgi:hypothetical protein
MPDGIMRPSCIIQVNRRCLDEDVRKRGIVLHSTIASPYGSGKNPTNISSRNLCKLYHSRPSHSCVALKHSKNIFGLSNV